MFNSVLEYAESVLPSIINRHSALCCSEAREWFLSMDRACQVQNRTVPAWLKQHFEWGPSGWPLYWCEAMEAKKLDCGALTALALEALTARKTHAAVCKTIRKFDARSVAQWRRVWGRAGFGADWAAGEYAYHETCAILSGGRVVVWDPSEGTVVIPDMLAGYGSTVAIKVQGAGPASLPWGHLHIPMNQWVTLNGPGAESTCEMPVRALMEVPAR